MIPEWRPQNETTKARTDAFWALGFDCCLIFAYLIIHILQVIHWVKNKKCWNKEVPVMFSHGIVCLGFCFAFVLFVWKPLLVSFCKDCSADRHTCYYISASQKALLYFLCRSSPHPYSMLVHTHTGTSISVQSNLNRNVQQCNRPALFKTAIPGSWVCLWGLLESQHSLCFDKQAAAKRRGGCMFRY